MATLGEIRRDFESRLSDDWHALAVQLEIPETTKNKWMKGYEAAGIWDWLNARRSLKSLAPALTAVNRQDLAALVEHLPSHSGPPSAPTVQAFIGLVVVVAAILIALGLARYFYPWEQREKLLLGGQTLALDSTAPLEEIYIAAPTLGKESLVKSIGPLNDNGWFGYVFLSNSLPEDYDKPTAKIEIQDADGKSIHNKSDRVRSG